jgi:hypothetical protein
VQRHAHPNVVVAKQIGGGDVGQDERREVGADQDDPVVVPGQLQRLEQEPHQCQD